MYLYIYIYIYRERDIYIYISSGAGRAAPLAPAREAGRARAGARSEKKRTDFPLQGISPDKGFAFLRDFPVEGIAGRARRTMESIDAGTG